MKHRMLMSKNIRSKMKHTEKLISYAKTLIGFTVTDHVHQQIMNTETAAEACDMLHQQFEATAKDQVIKSSTNFSRSFGCQVKVRVYPRSQTEKLMDRIE
jgi:hypothetical protein